MAHYICTGECGGVSEEPVVCQAENCTMHGEPLKECMCSDKENHVHPEKESSQK